MDEIDVSPKTIKFYFNGIKSKQKYLQEKVSFLLLTKKPVSSIHGNISLAVLPLLFLGELKGIFFENVSC